MFVVCLILCSWDAGLAHQVPVRDRIHSANWMVEGLALWSTACWVEMGRMCLADKWLDGS
jgi:hypothetical protein